MGSDKTGTHARGLAIQDQRLTSVWTAQSTGLQQADPRPGIPTSGGDYELVVNASGEMAADQSVRLYTHTGGAPGKTSGARVVWRDSSGVSLGNDYRGKDPASLITYWESINWIDGSGTPSSTIDPHMVTLSDQTVVLAYRYLASGVPSIAIRTRNKTTGAWGSASLVFTGSAAISCGLPGLVVLPDDKVMLYFWRQTNNEANIRAYVSTDKGANWSLASGGILASTISTAGSFGSGNAGFELGRLRGAYANGQVLLVGELQDHDTDKTSCQHFIQLASNSMGADFSQVEIASSDTVFTAAPEVVAHNGEFLIYSINSTVNQIKQTRIGSAYDSISNSYGNTVITGNAISETSFIFATLAGGGEYAADSDLAAFVDPEGRLYLVATYFGNGGGTGATKQVTIYRSDDNGESWAAVGTKGSLSTGGDGIWWESGDSSTYPTNYTATACQGRVIVVTNHGADPGNEDNSLSAFYLGGWSQVTFPQRGDYASQLDQGVWTRTWVPFDIPDDVGWTAAGTASTESIDTGVLAVAATGGGASRTYSLNPTSTETQGMILRFSVQCTVGSVTSDVYGVTLRLADGSNDRQITIRLSTDSFRVRDDNAGSALHTETSVDLDGSFIEFLVAMSESNLKIWYRTAGNGSDRTWTTAMTTTALNNNTGSPDSNNLIKWGALGAGSGKWAEFHYAVAADTGNQLSTGQDNPDGLMGEIYAGIGYRTYIDNGLFINASDGPGLPGQFYDIATRYGFSVDRIFAANSPSPRSRWRSTDTTAQTIAFQFDAVASTTAESDLGNEAICVALYGINFRSWTLEGYDVDTTAWVTIGAVDGSDGLSGLAFTRNGSTVVPNGDENLYLHLNELDGASISLNGTFRRIKTNTAGSWDTSATVKKTTLFLEGISNSDPTSHANGIIIPKNVAAVFNTNGAKYSGYRIQIPSQTTVDQYFEIGNVLAGPIEFFGRQYSWGRSITTTPNVELDTRQDGAIYSRKFGPAARAIRFGWAEGVDTSQIYASNPDPDYIKIHSSGGPVASVSDVPHQMDGLATLIGPDSPVVYLPAVDVGSSSVLVYNRRHEMMLGRLTGPVRVENVVGDELSDPGEVFRVSTIQIQELV
tara:strand:- start:3997 stop:7308 length:3312 start_codon:yes stop_codon:yes gene_type:complete